MKMRASAVSLLLLFLAACSGSRRSRDTQVVGIQGACPVEAWWCLGPRFLPRTCGPGCADHSRMRDDGCPLYWPSI